LVLVSECIVPKNQFIGLIFLCSNLQGFTVFVCQYATHSV